MTSSDDDAPLDPAVERIRRKLARLLFVSFGVMLVGFAAVLIAIVYRISQDSAPAASAAPVALDVPAADLRAASVDGDRLVLTIGGAEPRIEVRRLSDGAVLARFDLAR